MALTPFTGELDPPTAAGGNAPAKLQPFKGQLDDAPAPAATATQPKRSVGAELGRQVGLTARHAITGVAAIPAMAADAVAGVANKGLDVAMGEGQGFRFPKQTQALDNALTKAGLPQTETAQERWVGDATAALAGTGGLVKAGQVMAGKALPQQIPQPVSQAVGDALSKNPIIQGITSASSGAASGAVREAGGGEGAQLAAGIAGAIVPGMLAPQRVLTDAGRQTRNAAQAAGKQGYVIPPADLSPGMVSEALSGFSGKIKTAQEASSRNQNVSNRLARKALGVADDVDLNIDTLESIRRAAAGAYAPVAASGVVTPGKTYTSALDKALDAFTSQGKSFPGARVPKVVDDINALRSSQFDAGDALNMIRTMRENADISYRAGEAMSGKAYKQAAGALEDAIEDHLKSLGQPGGDLLKNFRDARQTIAKTYTVQGALNPQTGNVNAVKLGADLAKGKPLTDELRTAAEVGQAFPKATQALKEAPKATSPLDWLVAGGGVMGTGNPLPLAAVAARPAVRNVLLSDMAQRRALRTAGTEIRRVPEGAGAIVLGVAGRAGTEDAQSGPIYGNRLQAGAAARESGGQVVPVDGGYTVRLRR